VDIYMHLKSRFSATELFKIAKALHDNYQPFLLDCQVWELIKTIVPGDAYHELLQPLSNHIVGHRVVNDIVMNNYFGERKVKYHLSLKFMGREDEVSAFEFNVGSSRLDFARINGHSYAYEIKTELDSLDKLEKQITDYSKVFEYVHVVCHPEHFKKVKESVPEYCGIITYNTGKPDFPFSFKQKRSKNPELNLQVQLSTLTTKELEKIIRDEGWKSTLPMERIDREELILSKLTEEKINHLFKESIKRRFYKRWTYICENLDKIQPIDLQPFFKSNADPYWVYYKNSSMV